MARASKIDRRLGAPGASQQRRGLSAALIGAAATAAALVVAVPAATAATQATGFYIDGAGYGHGIGMSQYGAAGYAQNGYTYRQILAHYYEGTTLGQVSPSHQVRVLIKQGATSFQGSGTRLGPKTKLKPSLTYSVQPTSKGLLLSAGGKLYGVWKSPLIVSGKVPLDVPGLGQYRGQLEFVQTGSRVDTINVVGIEDYVRGVVAAEMPSTWPAQALEAQAVAARTFAVATNAVSKLFNVYDDTRSQVYRGVSAETPNSDAAVAATAGQIVEYGGAPALTYFFSSSGGYTESIQNVWQGVTPEAWLHGVPDPYDDSFDNPYYRWKETLSVNSAAGKLKRYLKGSLKGIEVLQHGVSPRIVKAAVVGSKGTVDISGQQLQTLFGLRSTYVAFTTITSKGVVSSGVVGSGGSGSSGSADAPDSAGTGGSGAVATSPGSGYGASGVGPSSTATTTPVGTTTVSQTSPTGGATPGGPATPTTTTGAVAAAASVRRGAPAIFMNDFAVAVPVGGLLSWAPAAYPVAGAQPAARITRQLLAAAHRAVVRSRRYTVTGSAYPTAPGSVVHVQRHRGNAWRTVASGHVTVGGTYSVRVKHPGSYRVVLHGVDGPAVTVS